MATVSLFVAGLAADDTPDTIREWFADFGSVSRATIISDRDAGRSKGFGFVEMGSDAEADAAIAALHGAKWHGRTLVVERAKPRPR